MEGFGRGFSLCEYHSWASTSELGDSCGNTVWIKNRTDGYLARCSGGPRKPGFAFPRRCQQELRIIVLWILENLLDGALLDDSATSQDPDVFSHARHDRQVVGNQQVGQRMGLL